MGLYGMFPLVKNITLQKKFSQLMREKRTNTVLIKCAHYQCVEFRSDIVRLKMLHTFAMVAQIMEDVLTNPGIRLIVQIAVCCRQDAMRLEAQIRSAQGIYAISWFTNAQSLMHRTYATRVKIQADVLTNPGAKRTVRTVASWRRSVSRAPPESLAKYPYTQGMQRITKLYECGRDDD